MAATQQHHSGSLYVGDLEESVNENFLYELFREAGHIISIRVCRDYKTKKSLGYAYVNFANTQDAERAMDSFNYTVLKGKPIRIMWSQRDPHLRKSGLGNIFIKNLDKSISNKDLYETFSTFGNILSCKVSIKKGPAEGEDEPTHRGYGFVHFETQEAAEQAIATMNGKLLNGKKVYVGPFIKRPERMKLVNIDQMYTNIFVKNLDKSITRDEFVKLFETVGEVQHADLAYDEHGKSKGFGFVNFKNHEDAVKAVQVMNDKEVKGKNIFVARHQRREERSILLQEQSNVPSYIQNRFAGNLYVKNLDDKFDDEKLKEIFAIHGKISSVKVMRDANGNSRGFGFVCFENPEDSSKALADMNGKIIGSKPLYVAVAQRKEVRQAQLEAQFRHRGVPFYPQGMPPLMFSQQPPMPYFAAHNQQQRFSSQHGFPKPRWMPPTGNVIDPMAANVPPHVMGGQHQPLSYAQAIGRGGSFGGRGGRRHAPHQHQQQRPKYKYNQNARNRPGDVPVQSTIIEHSVHAQQAAGDALQNLIQLPPEFQKDVIGNRLFSIIDMQFNNNEISGKITGMLLEMETSDLLHLLESPEALNSKIQEARAVLKI